MGSRDIRSFCERSCLVIALFALAPALAQTTPANNPSELNTESQREPKPQKQVEPIKPKASRKKAAREKTPPEKKEDKGDTRLERLEERFIRTNIKVSEKIDDWAEEVDIFLVGKRVTRKPNESFIRLENSTYIERDQGIRNETNINASIRLPNLEEYWQLRFSTYDEVRDARQNKAAPRRRSPRERNVGATVGVFKKLGAVRTTFQPRVELRDPLQVSHSLAFESWADMKTFRINPKLEFFADASRGVGVFQVLNFTFRISNMWSYSLINQGDYEEKYHRYSVSNGISVGQEFTDEEALSYNFFTLSNNRPNYHLQNYNISITWSQVLYRRILDYQITPYLEFDESRGFAGVPGVTLDLNLNF